VVPKKGQISKRYKAFQSIPQIHSLEGLALAQRRGTKRTI